MTIKKKQTKQSKTEVGLTPVSLADAIVAKRKELDTVEKKQFLHCPKCNRPYKIQASYDKHVQGCTATAPLERVNGGAREGGGRPKGSLSPQKLEMKIAREMMQQAIASKTNQLLTTQLRMAMGSSSLWKRWQEEITYGKLVNGNQKSQKVWRSEKVTNEGDYAIYFSLDHKPDGRAKDKDNGVEYFYITETKGDHQAVVNLLDRAYGKPKESVEIDTPPPEPMGVANTGTTVLLREKFVDMIKRTIIEGEVTDAK